MKIQTMFRMVVKKRPTAVRWAYLPMALVLFFFAVYGWGDEGFYAACPFLFLLAACLFQSIYPTLLGWGLLFGLSAAYAVAVAVSPNDGTREDYIFFFLCGAVPAVFLFFLRPKLTN